MKKQHAIIIAGGMGPMAGVDLHAKIIAFTPAARDQEHPTIIHTSHAQAVTDRTEYLLGRTDNNPAQEIFTVVKAAAATASHLGFDEAVVGIPCNTFHAPRIWDEFVDLMKKNELHHLRLIHMIEETVGHIEKILPHARRIGLMSSTGARQVGVYKPMLKAKGYNVLEVSDDLQDELHESIYDSTWGIKAQSNPVTQKARENILRYTTNLKEQGAEAIILGCTEIPLAIPERQIDGIPLIDPAMALARALIDTSIPHPALS